MAGAARSAVVGGSRVTRMSGRFTEVSGVSLAEQARESIRTAILDGTLAPEARITIEELAGELGISRTPIREALKALEGEGLIQLMPHRGAIVARFARDELDHRYSIRAMLEGYAAELACVADPEGMAVALERICARADELLDQPDLEDVSELVDLNLEFHATIREGARSPTLERILDQLRNPIGFSMAYWSDARRRRTSQEMHVQIADAFKLADPVRAKHLTERHLLEARDLLVVQHGERMQDADAQAPAGRA
jgi:GntR family transcriptional regulator, vanillate catabolism transcriptional regulator